MDINPNSIRRKAAKDSAAYTDLAISRALNEEEPIVTFRTTSTVEPPELSTLAVSFENNNKEFDYDESKKYGEIIKTEDGNIRVRLKAKISSESDLSELKLQVSLID
jgi:hypothetical protein